MNMRSMEMCTAFFFGGGEDMAPGGGPWFIEPFHEPYEATLGVLLMVGVVLFARTV